MSAGTRAWCRGQGAYDLRLLRGAAGTAAVARFAALRPPSAAFDRPAAAAGEESAVAYEEGCAQGADIC